MNFLKIIATGFVAAYFAFVGAFHTGTQQPANPTYQSTTSATVAVATVPPPVGTISTAQPVVVSPKTTDAKLPPTQTPLQSTVNVTPAATGKVAATIVTTSPQPPSSQPTQQSTTTTTASVCPAIETDFYNSVYQVYATENLVGTLLQTINSTISSANQLETGADMNLMSAYQEYSSADASVNSQMSAITSSADSINTNTTYEDNANLRIAQSDLLSAAADFDAFYKDDRQATAEIAVDPLDPLADENYTDGVDNGQSESQQGITEYAAATSTFATLWSEDSSTKTKNGCNPAGFQVYSDIANKVNNGLTCAQNGYTKGLDATMCQLYDGGTVQQRSTGYWAIINRPTQ